MKCTFVTILAFLSHLFILSAATAATIPPGHDRAGWGISAQQLKNIVVVEKILPGTNYHFAEHMEIDPDVYVQLEKEKNRKIEYYFYNKKLYKIFIVYDPKFVSDTDALYTQLKQRLVSHFGKANNVFTRKIFGLSVTHSQWEDSDTLLDLREGAGFVYQVRIDKIAQKLKLQANDPKAYLKKAI